MMGIPLIALISQILVNIEMLAGVLIATKAKGILNQILNYMMKKTIPKEDQKVRWFLLNCY
jgi:hypothetical protein